MNKHIAPKDFAGSKTMRLIAVPGPGDISTYSRLHELHLAAHALTVSITRYLNTPALPACADYRSERMEHVEQDIADMRKALGDG